MQRRDFLRNGSAYLLAAAGCATKSSTPPQAMYPPSPNAARWTRIMTASPGNLDIAVSADAVEGSIPDSLRGTTYLLNGPGRLGYGKALAHPFDGHGYLRSFYFDKEGGLSLKTRFIETDVFRVEQEAQRLVVPGIGTLASPGPKIPDAPTLRNVANTTVVPFGDKLLCGWEGGAPWSVEPGSLRTLGEETFGNTLQDVATLAHFRFDAQQSRFVTLSPALGRHTELTFREYDAAGKLRVERHTRIEGMLFAHDFVLTPNWYILARNPLRVNLWAFVQAQLGTGTLLDAIASDDAHPGGLVFVPRRGRGTVTATLVSTPRSLFAIHFANAFEQSAQVVVDVCAFESVEFGHEFGYLGAQATYLNPSAPDGRSPQRLVRVEANVNTGESRVRQMAAHAIDFPGVDARYAGRDAPFAIGATRVDLAHSDPFDALATIDLRDEEKPDGIWAPGRDRFVGEPVFFPRLDGPSPTSGYLVALVYDGKNESTTLVVLDNDKIQDGPVASVPFPLLPYGFHGYAWAEHALG